MVGELRNLGLVTVGEDDHGELLVREASDACGEANGVAAVPDFPQAAILSDVPAEPVGGVRVIGSRAGREGDLEQLAAHELVRVKRLVPLVEVSDRRIDAAVPQHRTREVLGGALEAGGKVVGVLADGFERAAMTRENRNFMLDEQLVLVSPYDPMAGFNVGHAMQRNKLIYAMANSALVVSSDYQKGGTWAGAIEQLEKLRFVPVYIRSKGIISKGLVIRRNKFLE